MSTRPSVLLIYTGGTIGMWADAAGTLRPMDLAHLEEHGASATGALLDLVPSGRRSDLRRTLVWLAKLGVIAPHW